MTRPGCLVSGLDKMPLRVQKTFKEFITSHAMQVLEIPAKQCESFKQLMQDTMWRITHQDAGQTHLVGWGYEIHWSLDDRKVILRYNDKQGVAIAFLEFSDAAFSQINALLTQLNADSDDSL